MDTFTFHFVTPEATFFSAQASMVEAPGALGDFGVLAGHMPFISTLRPGVVSIHDAEDRVTRVFVAGGIAEVNPGSCTILAEQVVDLAKLSHAEADMRLAKAHQTLEDTFEENARLDAVAEVELAEAIVQAMQ